MDRVFCSTRVYLVASAARWPTKELILCCFWTPGRTHPTRRRDTRRRDARRRRRRHKPTESYRIPQKHAFRVCTNISESLLGKVCMLYYSMQYVAVHIPYSCALHCVHASTHVRRGVRCPRVLCLLSALAGCNSSANGNVAHRILFRISGRKSARSHGPASLRRQR